MRAGFIASDRATLAQGLASLAAGMAPPGAIPDGVERFLAGGPPEWPAGLPHGPRPRLPGLPFARERFWIDNAAAPAVAAQPVPVPGRPQAAPGAGDAALRATMREVIADALYTTPDAVTDSSELRALGLDSILAVEMAKLLSERLGIAVRGIDFYEAGTVDGLAALLAGRGASAPDAAQDEPTPVPAAAAAAAGQEPPNEPIAIVGLAGRFPGAADLDEFWTLLREGTDAVTEIPPDRWRLDGFFDPARGAPGRSYSRWGGFLDGIDQFDPLFFRISPREAELIDPQERLFLTCAQAAVEQSGWVPGDLGGGAVGVFAGIMYGEWHLLAAEASAPDRFVPAHAPYWSVANRVSFTFGWRGPSMAVDSACSSSLTALHLACASLRRGECAAALAGGVNLSLHPRKYLGLSAGHFAASDGRCRSFGAGGDGYVPGEGVGVAVLKRLSDARRDGDTVLAVIRGSAVNHGGRTSGYAVPSPDGQAGAIRAALEDAGVGADSIGYVEAHGTGTALGDPIEIEGLRRALAPAEPVPIGSVKSNLGHLEAAAGMAALAKVVLQLRHRALVPSLHADPPNPELDLAGSGFAVVRALRPWPVTWDAAGRELPRRAGISSFGAGGSNTHLVLEEAPPPPARGTPPPGPFLVPLSAPSAAQLARLARALIAHLDALGGEDAWALPDLACTLTVGRTALAERAVLEAADLAGLRAGLAALAEDRDVPGVWRGRSAPAGSPPVEGARRVPLPPTPLAPIRCWLPDPIAPAAPTMPSRPVAPRVLRWAADDPVLTDHRIAGRMLVPAAALLLAVARGRGCVRLSNVVFAAPLEGGGAGATATLHVETDGFGERFSVTEGKQTFVSGRIGNPPPPGWRPTVPADGRDIGPGNFYEGLAAAGAVYGPAYRRIVSAHVSGDAARVVLRPGGPAAALLDAACHAAALLAPDPTAHAPFALDEAVFHGDIGQAASASLRRRPVDGVFSVDVALTDTAGGLLATLSGLVLRHVCRPSGATGTPDGMALLAPEWIAEPSPPRAAATGTVAVVGGPAAFRAALRLAHAPAVVRDIALDATAGGGARMAALVGDAEEIVFLAGLDQAPVPMDIDTALATLRTAEASGVLVLLDLLRTLYDSQPFRPRRLKLVTRGVQAVAADDPVQPWQAAALGLAKVAGLELPRLTCATIDLPPDWPDDATASLAALVAAEPGDAGRTEIALRGGRRLVRRISPVALPAPTFNPFRPMGVHVIAGGARGIGLEVACHIARRSRARLLLLGRSPPETADAALSAVASAGGTAIYRQADLLDPASVRAAVLEACTLWGPVNGAIHSALVLADRGLLRLDESFLRAALDPKARGAVALAEAVADQPLDFLAFFSSANAVFGNAGQANYVAGCRFKDAYAAHLRADRGLPALTIGWGFWGEVGVVASEELRARLLRQGILPISVAEGLDAFERALCAGVPHLLPVAGTAAAFERLGVRAAAAPDPAAPLYVAAGRHPETPAEAREDAALAALEAWGVETVADQLRGLGLSPGTQRAMTAWAARLSVTPSYQPLFSALLDMIGRAGLGTLADGRFTLHPASAPPARTAPTGLPAHARLLESCLASLPDVLTGRANGLAALMPGGSTALVEAVYRGASVTARLNRVLAACVGAHLAGRPADPPPRILEIGGGTGATTREVVATLAKARPDAAYLFTDISPAFLPAAERELRPVLPGLRTARVDIAGDPGVLGERDFDVVLAANVLHATGDLRASLAACRALLRPGGLLLLNETTRARDFATLTFGLTPGWWHAIDAGLRLPHGPAASGATWRRLLEEAGFGPVHCLPPDADAPQTIFAAVAGAAPKVQAIQAAAPPPSDDPLHAHLTRLIAGVLKLDPAVIDPADSFGTYGLESVMALEVIAALEPDFGPLRKTLLFETRTVAELAARLREINPSAAATAAKPPLPQGEAGAKPTGDAVAIVALAGRFPGARTPAELWALLRDGRDAITEVPPGRWDHAAHYDPDGRRDDKAHTRFGGFIDDADTFDAALFRISPAEARAIDPMERQFIEIVWELLENAGQTPERLKRGAANPLGGDVGIFVGVMSQTYEQLATELWAHGRYTGAFSSHSSIANRASFLFDFTGPSVAVDTACSSSLSALHMACEAIRRGDCRAAIAGGANLLLHPLHHILLSAYRVLSPDDRTRAFGAGAQGFVVGECVAAVLLRPLADALRDHDPVLGIVRGTAVNTCGRTSSYSAPSTTAQTSVIRAALTRAGLEPAAISYVEAHGTGTELGDPVEIHALCEAWGPPGPNRCAIGSIKPNIGHLEAAAGIAGLAKVLLQLRHGQLAPSLYAEPPNPNIDFAATPFRVQTRLAPWASGLAPRRAGLSSFGLGGANAHVIIEEPPAVTAAAPDDGGPVLVPVSARTEEQLRQHIRTLADAIAALPADVALRDIGWTLQAGRQPLAERWAAVAHDRAGLLAAMRDWLAGRSAAGVGHATSRRVGGETGAPADPARAGDALAMAAHWLAGGRIEPARLLRGFRPRIVPLPNYPFERRRFWLDEGPGFSRDSVSASRAAERAALPASVAAPRVAAPEPVADYYDATLPVRADRLDEAYFSLAPLTAPPPGFSWTRTVLDPDADPAAARALLEGQRALRRALLDGIEVRRGPVRMLDFGCGAGTDLIILARDNPHLTGHGRTLSPEHARVAAARVRLAGLDGRVAIEAGDSAGAPFPGKFDLIIGIEVAHHIRDKDRLLANLVAALAPGGRLALADCVAPRVGVSVPETGSYTLAESDYAATMARAGLRILRAVDMSAAVARCLDDPELDAVMARFAASAAAAERLTLVERVHRGWSNFGRALAQGQIRYLLLQLGADESGQDELSRANRSALASARVWSDEPAAAPAVAASVRACLARVLGVAPGEIDPHTPFAEQGLDSLGGLRLLDALAAELGCALDAALLYDHPTPAALTDAVAARVPAPPAPLAAPPITVPEQDPNAVAIVGLSVRLPGAPDQRRFWHVLRDGIDCVTEVPPDRWDPRLHWSPDQEARDRTYGKWGGFLNGHDRFDAGFFGISAREAALTDPQQRIFLETAWHALEDAGMTAPTLAGSRCGIYAGVCGDEYGMLLRTGDAPPDAYLMLGNAGSVLAARLGYLLDLKGPALAIDTACSSSLVALHLAVEAIRRGEVDLALAGGVSLYLGEWPFKQLSRAGMLSPTGRCRTFDAAADGIVPAEGVVAMVLKPLGRALADRDQIYGVVRGSGINGDGRTNGLTAPSAASQAALIGTVLDRAGVPADSIGMLEAHGTGTPLGDPIEAAGLVAAFSARTDRAGFCALGSLKSNFGHTTAASGLAGLAKLLLAFRHDLIPPSLHLDTPSKLLRLDGSAFRLAWRAEPWPAADAPRRGAVSAFGFSGTNAHVVVEEAPASARPAPEPGWRLVTLSGQDEAALARAAERLRDWLAQAEAPPALADLAYTLTLRRRHERVRAAFVVSDLAGLTAALSRPLARPLAPPPAGVSGPTPRVPRDSEPWRQWLQAHGAAYVAGGTPDPAALDEGDAARVVTLPGYPFARDRHWFTAPQTRNLPAPPDPTPVSLFAPAWLHSPELAASPEPGLTFAFLPDEMGQNAVARLLPGRVVAVRAGAASDHAALLDAHGVPDQVLHLWPLDAAASAEAALERGARGLFQLLQAITARRPARPVRLVLAYRLADRFAACHEAAGGLVGSAAQADPALLLSVLGLDPDAEAAATAHAVRELAQPPAEARIVGGVRMVRRLLPLNAPPTTPPATPPEPAGTVLLTGGLGGIGRALCRHLAGRDARLAIIGRGAPDAAAAAFLEDLSAQGVAAGYWRADVADRDALDAALGEIRHHFGPITQVHHLAGVMGESPLTTKPLAEFDSVLRAKIAGTLALDAATRADPLVRFVLHGSLAASVGDMGQGDYAVASRFLEAFAEAPTARGPGRTFCMAWPLWAEGGMRPGAASAVLLERLSGLAPIPTAAALRALEDTCATAAPVAVVACGTPEALKARLPLGAVAPNAADPNRLHDWLRARAAEVARTVPERIDPAASLIDAGFDSITLKELATVLSRGLGIEVSATLFYRHGSLNEVADHLRTAVPPATPSPLAASAAGKTPIAVIGLAGRFPGGADIDSFWASLLAGTDAIRQAPANRPGWAGERLAAGFIDGVDQFDAAFFQIAPREAALTDPQARLFLETAWHALESAGISPTGLAGTDTGVFLAAQSSDYAEILRGEFRAATGRRTGPRRHPQPAELPARPARAVGHHRRRLRRRADRGASGGARHPGGRVRTGDRRRGEPAAVARVQPQGGGHGRAGAGRPLQEFRPRR